MRLAIVGSVSLMGSREAADIIVLELERWRPNLVVSGGAVGIDQMGVAIAEAFGIETLVFPPKGTGWVHYKYRNMQIAMSLRPHIDMLLRIAAKDSKTYGSGWTRDRAKERGVSCVEYLL